KAVETKAATAKVREKPKPAIQPRSAKSQVPKRRNPAALVIDFEQAIVDLEDRLKEIETQLQQATMNQDFDEMTRLGEEHVQTQAELERSLEEWDS
ncbi:MAG: ABC transporter C-terminal domain-containing protein, partial [Chloroflexota bacterium]|nr:ABC transporter C-terminal domain-containing protein [Chloroflexota bacterium]